MKIEYFIPPAAQRRGGIDLAIAGMRGALRERHEIVQRESGVPEKETELVHFHGLWQPGHLAAYRECKRRQLPYLISPHGMLEPWAYRHRRWKKWPWLKLFGQAQLNSARATLATSRMESNNLQRFTDNTEIAPLGLDDEIPITRKEAREHLRIHDEQKVVLYLSRIDRKKGLDYLIEAAAEHPNDEFWVVGDGDQKFATALQQVAGKNVRWCGPAWGTDRWKYLIAADLFCLPTHSENFGFAILEALWAGTPTLTTDKTPWCDHVSVEGLHICNDRLDSVKVALRGLLPNLTRPRSLASWAREHFHWDRLADTYDQIYASAARS